MEFTVNFLSFLVNCRSYSFSSYREHKFREKYMGKIAGQCSAYTQYPAVVCCKSVTCPIFCTLGQPTGFLVISKIYEFPHAMEMLVFEREWNNLKVNIQLILSILLSLIMFSKISERDFGQMVHLIHGLNPFVLSSTYMYHYFQKFITSSKINTEFLLRACFQD